VKISLVGLPNSGKTSIYSVAFAEKSAADCKNFSPTTQYEVHKHPFLGLQLAVLDLGGQEALKKEYLEDESLFKDTSILVPVINVQDPDKFNMARQYLIEALNAYRKNNEKPRVFLLFHKYDTEHFNENQLKNNLEHAKRIFLDLFKDYDFEFALTSIFDQEGLSKVVRDILLSSYLKIKSHIEKAEKQLEEIKAKVIITDISGNVIAHNFGGVSSGLTLRTDLRYFMDAGNKVRENIFSSDSIEIITRNPEGAELELHIFKYILSVFIMKSGVLDEVSQNQLKVLLTDMKFFADLIIAETST
jgi:GTPase SAR1 family protein